MQLFLRVRERGRLSGAGECAHYGALASLHAHGFAGFKRRVCNYAAESPIIDSPCRFVFDFFPFLMPPSPLMNEAVRTGVHKPN